MIAIFRETGSLARDHRADPERCQVPLSQLAQDNRRARSMGIKSEAAIPNAWIYVDVKGNDVAPTFRGLSAQLMKTIQLPSGYKAYRMIRRRARACRQFCSGVLPIRPSNRNLFISRTTELLKRLRRSRLMSHTNYEVIRQNR